MAGTPVTFHLTRYFDEKGTQPLFPAATQMIGLVNDETSTFYPFIKDNLKNLKNISLHLGRAMTTIGT